jgi:small conductance mechanosensitive channel
MRVRGGDDNMNQHLDTLDRIRTTAVDYALKFGPKVLVAVAILVAGYFAGRWIGKWLLRWLEHMQLEPPVRQLMVKLVRLVVLGLFALMALQNLGVELLPLLAGLGVVGAGIALATQGVLSNVVAGLTIIFTKPFRVGEYVSLLHEEGVVLGVTLFSTTLGHWDRSRVVIPNRKIVGEILHNYGEIRQLDLSVGVAYEADVGQALATVDEVLRASPRVLKEHAPVLQVTSLSASSIDIAVRPWVKVTDFVAASGELNRSIVEALRARGIGHPFPQQELRVVAGSSGDGMSVLRFPPFESARQASVTR